MLIGPGNPLWSYNAANAVFTSLGNGTVSLTRFCPGVQDAVRPGLIISGKVPMPVIDGKTIKSQRHIADVSEKKQKASVRAMMTAKKLETKPEELVAAMKPDCTAERSQRTTKRHQCGDGLLKTTCTCDYDIKERYKRMGRPMPCMVFVHDHVSYRGHSVPVGLCDEKSGEECTTAYRVWASDVDDILDDNDLSGRFRELAEGLINQVANIPDTSVYNRAVKG